MLNQDASSHNVRQNIFSLLFELEHDILALSMTGSLSCSFFFSSRRRHTRFKCDWSSDVCSSDLHLRPVSGIRAFFDSAADPAGLAARFIEFAPELRLEEPTDWAQVARDAWPPMLVDRKSVV